MNRSTWMRSLAAGLLLGMIGIASAQDWPQWRGQNRDGKVVGFKAPATWPKELTQKWKTAIGDGVATPALVGDKLFTFSREGNDEIIRCLSAETGKEIWQDKYPAQPATGAAGGFPGPRSSPAVAEGVVCTLGVSGMVSCLDAASGKLLWRNKDYNGSYPRFYTSSSPLIQDGVCVVQVGANGRGGGVVAFDIKSGDKKWEWKGDGPAYGSPVLATIAGEKTVLMPTAGNMAALGVADGKQLWFVGYNQGDNYNAASPIVTGDTVIYGGLQVGMSAEKLAKKGAEFEGTIVWTNPEHSIGYNSPVLKDGKLYGLSRNNVLFCLDAATGKSAWSTALSAAEGNAAAPAPAAAPGGGFGGQGKGGGGRGGGRGGYGSVVDAGSALFALSPSGTLVVYEPSATEFKKLASYKVAEGKTYAYPVLAGNRVFIKDGNSVILYTIE